MRSALLGELKIRKKELTARADALENELVGIEEELDAIDILLGEPNGESIVEKSNEKGHKSKRIAIGTPKGSNSWEEYAKIVLEEIGGIGKSQEVIEYAKKANVRIKEKTITDTMRGILSKLGTNGVIEVKKAAIKSEGNVYSLK